MFFACPPPPQMLTKILAIAKGERLGKKNTLWQLKISNDCLKRIRADFALIRW
jgi:hypothetical protein